LMEILTLAQTRKLARRIPVLLYGTSYWKEIINFDALLRHGMVSPEDLQLFEYVDNPAMAFEMLQAALVPEQPDKVPAFASSRTPA
jgi:predicted Rossmann-fold nucleotide-binding protein